MSKKYIIEYSDKFLIGGKYNEESISNFKIKRNMESYKVDNINSKKLSSVYKLFFNFEGDNDIEFLSSEKFGGAGAGASKSDPEDILKQIMDLMVGLGDPNSLVMVEYSREDSFESFFTNPESYERVKALIKSKWTQEKILSSPNNKCQLKSGSTIRHQILTRAGTSISFGLRLIGQRIKTHGLSTSNRNDIEGDCIRMLDPDEILGESDCRFVVKLDGLTRKSSIKPINLKPVSPALDLNILEVMSGNGEAAATIIPILLASGIKIVGYKSTDVIESPARQGMDLGSNDSGPIFSFDRCDTIDAVSRYGEMSNTLLMISPPPADKIRSEDDLIGNTEFVGYGDFYACEEYIRQTQRMEGNNNKFIIIVGELGAGDGTPGIYKYLMENTNLDLIHRNRILFESIAMTGARIKEVYIFRTNFKN